MKTCSIMVRILVGVAVTVLSCVISNSRAASATPLPIANAQVGQPFLFQNVKWEEARIEKLQHAYHLLEHADGDYGGHRAAAMRSIKKAAEVLGVEIKGGGHAEEAQWTSDHKLREAKNLLAELIDQSPGKEQPHVRRAVKELDKALIIK